MAELLPHPFIFLRHGETFYNRARIIAGRLDVPLTPRGEDQARHVSALLGGQAWTHIAVSTMFRARKTARLAVPGGEFHFYDGLRERDWGDLENTPQQEPMPYFETHGDGESWAVFQQRVLESLNDVLMHFERPLIVAHSGVFRVIRNVTQGTPLGPRVDNVAPVLCQPPTSRQDRWSLTPWTEKDALGAVTQ